ncbi:hypothetical protein ACIP9H_40460 [Streptomyces sp. NPDC088732]|uniref:hypothetical protein n=1 Tax=Streptomyces sp. NPDC088732 TaxID=3365879 RepID=UPI003827CEC7
MGEVEQATRDEVIALRVSTVAPGSVAVAIKLAREMDGAEGGPLARVAHEWRAVMADLRRLAPADRKGDVVDGINDDRAERKARLRAITSSGE